MSIHNLPTNPDQYLEFAIQLETEFYQEKEKACSIISEILAYNSPQNFLRKKSVVRSVKRMKQPK